MRVSRVRIPPGPPFIFAPLATRCFPIGCSVFLFQRKAFLLFFRGYSDWFLTELIYFKASHSFEAWERRLEIEREPSIEGSRSARWAYRLCVTKEYREANKARVRIEADS